MSDIVINPKNKKAYWDQCVCKKCGFTWRASQDEYFNFSFCYSCHSDKIGGKFLDKKNKK